jgi:uncharacterized membrane protein
MTAENQGSDTDSADNDSADVATTPPGKRRSVGSWVVIGAFLVSGVTHIVNPTAFLFLLPEWTPFPLLIIWLSGVAEISAALGLLLKLRFAPAYTVLVLLAIWPANWWFAIDQTVNGEWWVAVAAWLRLPLQIPLIWWAWKSPRRLRRL